MTLLSLIQNASDTIGLARPSAVVSSTDGSVRTLLSLAGTEGRELLERYSWPATQIEATHTTLAAELQGVMTTIAAGFGYIINETFWDRTLTQPVTGPLTPSEWQALKARTATGPYASYRIQGGSLYAYPAPAAGNTWAFEYQSTYFCQSSGGSNQSAWAADTDTGVLDENLMALGVVWRFKKKNGLDYSEDYRVYEQKLANEMARVGGKRTLLMGGGGYVSGIFTPEGSWSV
ncbi:MAG: hypothetical protein O3C57_01285 [Verrucomicrobia bacterium]|nr:hypothetical protein [Verrucomicrobiota bacterium]